MPTDWAVVSMCRVEDRFRDHPIRREVCLIDSTGDTNPGLDLVVDGWDEPTATAHVAEIWPSLRHHNTTFTELLQTWE